jgi:hypothetical protein
LRSALLTATGRHARRATAPLPIDDAPNVGLGLAAGRIEAAAPHPSDTGDMYVAAGVPVIRLFLAFVICLLAQSETAMVRRSLLH